MTGPTGATASPSAPRRFRSGGFEAVGAGTEWQVVVADSWFVRDGAVLALPHHRARFLRAVPEHLRDDARQFWQTMTAELPRDGEWFPRVDLVTRDHRAEFRLSIRPSPARSRTARVITHDGPDPRTRPTVKGPDLARMLRVRAMAHEAGADEAAIVSPAGHVIEGAYSALVWWREDALCLPAPELERIDSVTCRVLLEVAASRGVEVRAERSTVAELAGTEVWALSALHGIRLVTDWIGGPALIEAAGRVDDWRRDLAALRHPLD